MLATTGDRRRLEWNENCDPELESPKDYTLVDLSEPQRAKKFDGRPDMPVMT